MRWFLVVVVSIFVIPRPGISQDEQERPRFSVSVDAVYLNVVVTDSSGRFHSGLSAEDFEILEDGVPQRLRFFTNERTPVRVVLLLDNSSSIHHSLDGVKQAANNFLRRMETDDRAAVALFNEELRFVSGFTSDVKALRRAVGTMKAGGATALYDAVLGSLTRLSHFDGRTALLVFSDGADSQPDEMGSRASMNQAVEGAKRSEASIYTVGFLGASPEGYAIHRSFLDELALASGGRSFYPDDLKELNDVFYQIQLDVHSQYRMAYAPSKPVSDGSWREIEVKVKDSKALNVRARQGYYAKQ
jgi:Ca-activated chloride channel family protein